MLTKSGKTLEEVIKKALEDHRITNDEYEEIIHLAHEDVIIDKHEQILLNELQKMISDKTVKRVP